MKTLIIIGTVPGNEKILMNCMDSIIKYTKQEYTLMIIKNDYKGFAVANNVGLRSLNKHEAVVLLNDDVLVSKGWLEEFQRAAKEKKAQLIGIDIRRGNHTAFYAVYITRQVIRKIGLLDEQFRYGEFEDTDYCLRALDNGFKLAKVDELFIYHRCHGTLKHLDHEKRMQVSENKRRFVKKYANTKWITQFRDLI